MTKVFRDLLLLFLALLLSGCGPSGAGSGAAKAVKFTMRGFERAVQGCGDAEKSPHPCVTYRVTWPEVIEAPSTEAAQRMNHEIQQALRPHPPSPDWAREAELLEAAYEEFQQTRFDNEVIFYHRRVAEVIRVTKEIISISITEEHFIGEEPPEFHQNFLNFDPRTGALLSLEALLAPGAAARLRHYEADPRTTPFAPAPEGLFLANAPGLPPLLVPWSEAASLFPPGSPIVPAPDRYTGK